MATALAVALAVGGGPVAGVAGAGAAGAAARPSSAPSVLIAFVSGPAGEAPDALGPRLAALPGMSLGLLSATEGSYRAAQLLLDLTQGARIAGSSYTRHLPAALSVVVTGAGHSARVSDWAAAVRRAHEAPARLEPGLLSSSIPGGAAYVGAGGRGANLDAVAAAGPDGRVGAYSSGPAATLPARLAGLSSTHRLVVADLPAGPTGLAQLSTLLRARAPGQLVIVIQRTPDRPGNELLWIGAAGLGRGGELTSDTTNEHGLVSAVDIAPTALRQLGLRVPDAMNGRPIRTQGTLRPAHLRDLADRLRAVSGRRLPALLWLVVAWGLLVALLVRSPCGRRAALRIGALAMLWTPSAVLVTAALAPGRTAEKAILTATCFLLGALTDRLVPWPRAALVPAVVAVVALAVDALAGTQLLARSLLGPNPVYGARFYGIGNELKSGLCVLVLAAVAAALTPARRSRRAAAAMAVAGVALAVLEGSARLGAGVGGVILVAAGTAVATIMLLPGSFSRRRVLIVLASPIVALAALAALDLATAHGTGHFNGSVLHARSAGDLRDVLVRRYGNAWGALRNGLMPVATALALIAAIVGVREQRRLLAPLPDAGWRAALAGGLTAGVVGTLVEDSGPVLLVVAVFALGCVLAYLHGAPLGAPRGAEAAEAPTGVADDAARATRPAQGAQA
jgi:hypothetical protein